MSDEPKRKRRRPRKIQDEDILRLNNLGISLSTMAAMLDCHPTAVSQRLKLLAVEASDARRGFMESIYERLTDEQQDWLAELIGTSNDIRTLITRLLVEEYERSKEA